MKTWWIWALALAFLMTACSGSDDSGTEPASEPTKATEQPKAAKSADIEVMDLSADGTRFVSAEFPVSDAFTNDGTILNLKEGCVTAIQTAKGQTEGWYDYDIIQCMGMGDWTDDGPFVGSANFSGALLSEISDADMKSDPEAFWDRAESSSISTYVQD